MAIVPTACLDGSCGHTVLTLCDEAGPFLRFIDACTDPPTLVGDSTLSGEPYEPVGDVSVCSSGGGGGDCSTVVSSRLCDDVGPFLRLLKVACSGSVSAVADVALDGVTSYVTTGEVGNCPVELAGPDGTIASVYPRTDAVPSLSVADDCQHMQAQTLTLVPSTDTPIVFAQPVRIIRIKNWSTSARLLVKDAAITDDLDPDATRVGIAPTAAVPGKDVFILVTDTIHVQSPNAAEISVEGYW